MATNSAINSTNPIQIARGGTNATTFTTTDGTIYFDGTRLVTTTTGTAGQVLTSAGPGLAPAYGNIVFAIAGNTGTATSVADVVNLISQETDSGQSVSFVATGNTMKLFLTTANHNTFIGASCGQPEIPGMIGNTGLGFTCLQRVTTGDYNVGIGYAAANFVTSSNNNIAIGPFSLGVSDNSSNANIALGQNSLFQAGSLGNCVGNIGIGIGAAYGFGGGDFNIAIGSGDGTGVNGAGSDWTGGAESSNICIGNVGMQFDANTIRIGTQGAGGGQQNLCYVAGIATVNVGSVANVVSIDTATSQLGTTAITAGTGISVTPGANTITIASSVSPVLTINGDSGTATPAAGAITFTGTSTYAGKTVVFEGNTAAVRLKTSDANHNIAIGELAGAGITTATDCTAVGRGAMNALQDGASSVAFGFSALANSTTPNVSTALGYRSLGTLTTGSYNTSIGALSGFAYTGAESSNLLIGYNVQGTIGESNTCRIGVGTGTGNGQLNATFIQGVAGVTVANTAAVLVDTTTGQFGTVISSRRFKKDIQDLSTKSSRIFDLRPTSFLFKDKPEMGEQYGLIAEEVAEVMPELVTYDSSGRPASVKYHDLPVLLLNEIQKLRKEIEALKLK